MSLIRFLGKLPIIREFRNLTRSTRDLVESTRDLKQTFQDRKTLKSESPEGAKLIQEMLQSEEGKFVISCGVLTSEEIARLPVASLGLWLQDSIAAVKLMGRDVYEMTIPELRKKTLKKFKL